ncbi:MAG: cell surface protein SprA [Candidatus Eisenbacteria bacterium]|nr:cell surface protein SprA [Candidatus Eisenbacteria bacterium]
MNRLAVVIALVLALVPVAAAAALTGARDWYPRGDVLARRPLLFRPQGMLLPPHMYLAVKPGLGLKSVDFSVDSDSGVVRRTASVMGVDVEPPVTVPLSQYAMLMGRHKYAQMWKTEARRGIRDVSKAGSAGGLFSIDLPIKFPRAVQAVVGKGKPNLRVTGSETISFSGSSSWTVGQKYSEYGRQSKFPRLDMRQDLVVKLDGSIGDKIDVDWDQSSAVRTELQNRIRIKYHGYDDEVIQSVDLGNTNLSIPNTQYVSYSGTHEGLFGIKTVAKLGSVDLAVIASKQEGKPDKQRLLGGAKEVQKQISDLDNKKRTYFFLDPPDFPDFGALSVIDPASVQVYIDDLNGYNNEAGTMKTKRAYLYKADGTKDTTYFEGNFDVKEPNLDYTFEYFYGSYFPILVIRGGLPSNYVMAVTYREVVGGEERWVGNPSPSELELKIIAAPVDELAVDVTTGKWGPLARHELKNIYYLGSEAIIKDSFKLAIKKRSGGAGVDEEALNEVPYIQILGLDTRGLTAGSPPDGLIDEGQLLDLTNGILVFPDLHPFAPDSFDITSWVIGARPDTLSGDEANVNIYTKKSPNYYLDTRYYLDVEYRSPQTTFYLGWNVLENSEVVTLNGVTLQRGVGYTIDYDTGELVLLTDDALEPNAEVAVDFSRASALGLSKTLLGFSTQYKPTDEMSFGTTWLYESKGTTEERPRLEQEPSRTIVGGLSTAMKFSPVFMTSMVDALPLVRTRERSSLALSGELGLSIPNPNTRNEVYIDDMEGNKETRPLALTRTQWKPGSIPDDPFLTVTPTGKRALWWYNLHSQYNQANVVHEGDLYPERTAEERERAVTALELYFNQTGGAHGLTQVLSWLGEDFTEMQYVEVWVNDFASGRDPSKKMRLSLGTVSEDGTWDPDSLPNGRLDSEDTSPPNGELDISPTDEDTGLDGKMNGVESCVAGVTGDPPDCSEDDYRYEPETAPTDFSHINGTEGNRLAMAHPVPDTEDLDGDGTLDTDQDYVEYVVSLEQDSRFQVRDNGNGWRLFRIPLSDTLASKVGLPSWDNVKHARLWFDGFAEGEKLQIAGIEVVGNRWVLTPISNESSYAEGERFYVGVINNKDNGDIYHPPPIEIGEENNIPNREQSLVLTATNLFPSDTVSAYKAFAGGSDYTQYRSLKFWLRGDSDSLLYFIRFGTDSLNYYEYATTVPYSWQLKEFDLEDLSIIKVGLPSSVTDTTIRSPDGWLRLRGRPSFTSVKRITMGLINSPSRTDSAMVASDSVWVDELILTGVKREKGMAKRLFVETKFADLLSLTTQMESRDQDFLSIGSTKGSGRRTDTYSVSGSMALHKFIPGGQFNIPVTFSISSRKEVPKFRSGDDIVLTSELEEAQTARSGTSIVGFSFRKSPSPNKWLRYTLEAVGLGMSLTKTHSASVSSVDSSRAIAGSFSYTFSPPGKSALQIPFGKGRKLSLSLLPRSLVFSVRGTTSRSKSYSRDTEDPLTLIPRTDVRRRVADLSAQTSYVPISILKCSYSMNTSRDWQVYNASKTFGNIGTEVSRSQSFRSDLTPRLGNWLTPNVSFSSTYTEDHRPEITRADDTSEIRNFSNSGAISFGLAIPLSRLAQVLTGAGKGASKDTASVSQGGGFRPMGLLLAKIGDIRASHSISYGSSYSRMYGKPNFSYMMGLRRAFGGNARFADDGVATSSIGNTTSLSASGRIMSGITLDGRFETSDREVESLAGVRVEKKTTWPELKMGWNGVERHLRISETVTSLRLDSSFKRTVDESGARGKPSEKVVTKSDWQPLLNLTASWKNGLRTSYTSGYSTTQTESYVGSGYTSKSTTTRHSFSVQKTLDATKGISLPFVSSKKFKLKSSVNLGLTVQYSGVSSTIPPQVSEKRDDLSVTSTATYSFSANLSGSFNFGFTQNRDLQIGVTRRGMTIGLTASFRF